MAQGLIPDLKINLNLPKSVEIPGAGQVSLRQFEKATEQVMSRSSEMLAASVVSIFIVVGGYFLAVSVGAWVSRALRKAHVEATLAAFLGSMARNLLFLSTALVVLAQFGIQVASIAAVLGAAAVAIGLGMKNTMSNVSSGIMLLVSRPFKVGDWIQVGAIEGTVKRVTLFNTELNTLTNQRVFLPNNHMWDGALINHTYNKLRLIELSLEVVYGTPPAAVAKVIKDALAQDVLILRDPEPLVAPWEFVATGMKFIVRVWVQTDNWMAVREAMVGRIHAALTKAGVDIRFAQQVVYNRFENTPPVKGVPLGKDAPAPKTPVKKSKK